MALETHKVLLPEWLDQLAEQIVDALDPLPTYVMHYFWWEPGDPHNLYPGWQLAFSPQAAEHVGGAEDGKVESPGFFANLSQIMGYFSKINLVAWHAPTRYNNWLDGPHLSIEGQYGEQRLWLRIYQLPNVDEPCKISSRTWAEDR